MPTYMNMKDVIRLLETSRPTLRRMMTSTPKGVAKPWRNTGTKGRPKYMWNADLIDAWLTALPANGK